MADKKSTSNSGLFGQPLGGDLDFSQFSGPKLFTPAPLPPDDANQELYTSQDASFQSVKSIQNLPPKPFGNPSPLQSFGNISLHGPNRMENVSTSNSFSQPQMPPNHLYQSSPSYHQSGVSMSPSQIPPTLGSTTSSMTSIPTFNQSMNATGNQFLTGPMIPSSSLPLTPTLTSINNPYTADESIRSTVNTHNLSMLSSNDVAQPTNNQYFQPNSNQPFEPPQVVPDAPNEYNISPFASISNQHGGNTMQQTPKVVPHWYFLRKWTITVPFYKVLSEWIPFSKADSHKLEHEFLLHRTSKNVIVHTDGGRYDVDLSEMTRQAVYWNEEATEVRRCTWFFKEENQFLPYKPLYAEKLEDEYLAMMSKGIFNIRVDLPDNSFVLFHNPSVFVQYSTNQEMEWSGEDSKARPKVVKRGISEEESLQIPQGEEGPIEHIVFVVHGIGPVADLRMRSIIECVDDLRKNSLQFSNNNGFTIKGRPANRVEFFPIQWYSSVRDDKFGIDKQLDALSLPSISKLRNFTNETLTDILFFTSPLYCQTICDTVVNEMNRIFKLFKSRNPTFNGKASICGHSLGSVISFDILANQGGTSHPTGSSSEMFEDNGEVVENSINKSFSESVNRSSPNTSLGASSFETTSNCTIQDVLNKLKLSHLEKQFAEEQIDFDTLMMCQEDDLKDLGIPFGPRKKLMAHIKNKPPVNQPSTLSPSTSTSVSPVSSPLATRGTQTPTKVGGKAFSTTDSIQFSFKTSHVGTGQPLVTYKQLEFETENLFALGSPIGLFLTCRGVSNIGLDYKLPKCGSFMNIFHPYDPVVYRLEPMINELIDIPPVLIPHHKGRKRFHLEIKENLTRVSAKVKSGFLHAVNRTWTSINDFARSHQADYQPTQPVEEEVKTLETTDAALQEELARKAKEASLDFGKLNDGQRIDFVLQEKPFEILNEYLFALGSHACYWTSEDVALLMLKQIYKVKE